MRFLLLAFFISSSSFAGGELSGESFFNQEIRVCFATEEASAFTESEKNIVIDTVLTGEMGFMFTGLEDCREDKQVDAIIAKNNSSLELQEKAEAQLAKIINITVEEKIESVEAAESLKLQTTLAFADLTNSFNEELDEMIEDEEIISELSEQSLGDGMEDI